MERLHIVHAPSWMQQLTYCLLILGTAGVGSLYLSSSATACLPYHLTCICGFICAHIIDIARFYHPVMDVPNWRPARLIGELRASEGQPGTFWKTEASPASPAQGIPVPDNKDSPSLNNACAKHSAILFVGSRLHCTCRGRYGKQFVRPERKFNKVKVPKSLEARNFAHELDDDHDAAALRRFVLCLSATEPCFPL